MREKCQIGEEILMPYETKKQHKADVYGVFLVKCGAKFTAKMVVSTYEYRF